MDTERRGRPVADFIARRLISVVPGPSQRSSFMPCSWRPRPTLFERAESPFRWPPLFPFPARWVSTLSLPCRSLSSRVDRCSDASAGWWRWGAKANSGAPIPVQKTWYCGKCLYHCLYFPIPTSSLSSHNAFNMEPKTIIRARDWPVQPVSPHNRCQLLFRPARVVLQIRTSPLGG